jgi:hypothetical protein
MADKASVQAAIVAAQATLPALTEEQDGLGQGPDQQRLNIAATTAALAAAKAEADALT